MSGDRGLRILLAEDNKVNQEIAARLLAQLGHTVTLAANGAEAVALAAGQPFDVVLMDMIMPGMNGLEAARAIRAAAGPQSSLPIIALTANVFPADHEACLAAGMNDFLTKPLTKAGLAAALVPWARNGEAGTEPTISSRRLDQLRTDLGEKTLARLLESFVADAEMQLRDLRSAFEAGDERQVGHILHTLKGSAANMGFTQVETLAIEMALAPDEAACARLADALDRARAAAMRLRDDIAAAR